MMITLNRRGLSLIELLLDVAILALVSLMLAHSVRYLYRHTTSGNDKAYATQKAIQMMEEIRGAVAADTSGTQAIVDSFNDYKNGLNPDPRTVLTTHAGIADPADPLSGNPDLRYTRLIDVQPVPNDPQSKRVYVRVYLAKGNQLLAETMSVLHNIKTVYAPTQVYDIYVLGLENVVGWWTKVSGMRPAFDGILQDLRSRNPTLEFRIHWITRLAYGRDRYYRPFLNSDLEATDPAASGWVYFYPGKVRATHTNIQYFHYVGNNIRGNLQIDKRPPQGSYPLADTFNHAVRYPDEEVLYESAKTAAAADGKPKPEMSLRMLLEKLNTDPSGELKNAMIVNLHGELLPLPPMHNYSDAAKDPINQKFLRVVTHPEHLHYNAAEHLRFRVYAYMTNGASRPALPDITLKFLNIHDPALSHFTVQKLEGNKTLGYSWKVLAVRPGDYELKDVVTGPTPGMQVTLHNTELDTEAISGPTGLPIAMRPYGIPYIPCLTGVGEFSVPTFAVPAASGTLADLNNVPRPNRHSGKASPRCGPRTRCS